MITRLWNLINKDLFLAIGFKPGILCLLKMVHLVGTVKLKHSFDCLFIVYVPSPVLSPTYSRFLSIVLYAFISSPPPFLPFLPSSFIVHFLLPS